MIPDYQNTINRQGTAVLNQFIDAVDMNHAAQIIINWAMDHKSKTVCLCNVHSVITAQDDTELTYAIKDADMVLPDGAPIAWTMRRKGFRNQSRIAGPDLMLHLCSLAQNSGISIFLFGSSLDNLNKLKENLGRMFPHLNIAGLLSPRFGQWSTEEEQDYLKKINSSDPGIIFVGLGCPRQEIWMAKNVNNIHGVLLGVGAAFDFHAGTIQRAPMIFQRLGLEWLCRLMSEPNRLWKRYLITNTRFIMLSITKLFEK